MSPKASLLILVAGLAALWSFSGSQKPTAAEPPVTLSSGHSHDNLTVFILRGTDVLESKNILTLQEALEKNLAIVHETSSVNMLEVENLSPDHELFLQSGDIVKGGKQDRLVSQDLLIPAKSGRVPCPANCCEHNRWQQRGGEASGKFEKSTDFAVGNDIKIANVARAQGAVWDNVAKKQADLSKTLGKPVTENASPSSLQLALEDKDLRAKVAAYERDLGGLANAYPDAVGVVIAVNGQVIASDVYGSRLLFQKAWPKLLKSAAADAVAQMPKGEVVVASRGEAAKFLVAKTQNDALFAFEPLDFPAREQRRASLADPFAVEVRDRMDLGGEVQVAQQDSVALAQLNESLRDQTLTGRSGATSERSANSAGATRNPGRGNLNPNISAQDNIIMGGRDVRFQGRGVGDQTVAWASATPQPAAPAVVAFESRAGAQGNALIHRGQLKK